MRRRPNLFVISAMALMLGLGGWPLAPSAQAAASACRADYKGPSTPPASPPSSPPAPTTKARGAVGAFFRNDHTHFEAAGARQIAGLITTALREQGIALAAYLR